jgi:uncharacterized protein
MKIIVAGGSGFLGAPLCEAWAEDGHDVRMLTRALPPGVSRHESGTGVPGVTRVGWSPDGTAGMLTPVIDGAAAIVNLAGDPLHRRRWSAARKQVLRESRLLPTRSLVEAVAAAANRPAVLVNASAVGYYGDTGNGPVTESSPAGSDFLARLCHDWEAEAQRASSPGVRVVTLRSGVVLERSGGALPKMARLFRYFAGGRLGSGRQYFAWIHRLDWIEMVRWIVDTPSLSGAINATAPHPVTNAHFTRALRRVLHRPALFPVPGFMLRAVVGEMADALLTGQRVFPARAQEAGFHFRYPEIEIALRGIFANP